MKKNLNYSKFILLAFAFLFGLCPSEFRVANAQIEKDNLYDDYGGYKRISQPATGYFTLGKANGRHYFFTPDGNAYFPLGINHFDYKEIKEGERTVKLLQAMGYAPEEKSDVNWRFDKMVEMLRDPGFTAGDNGGANWMLTRIPCTKKIFLVDMASYCPKDRFRFEDVFDPAFLTALHIKIKKTVLLDPRKIRPNISEFL